MMDKTRRRSNGSMAPVRQNAAQGPFYGVYDGSQHQIHLMTLKWKMRLSTGNCTDFVGLATTHEHND